MRRLAVAPQSRRHQSSAELQEALLTGQLVEFYDGSILRGGVLCLDRIYSIGAISAGAFSVKIIAETP